MKKTPKLFQEINNAIFRQEQPISIIQFVTRRCNARCPHCFVDFQTKQNELTIDEIEKITNTTGNCLKNIALTGGEPFLRDDIFEIANLWYKNSTTQSISITTNGSLPEKIESFTKNIIKHNLPVSFFFSYDYIGEKHSEYRNLKDLHINVVESYKIIKKLNNNINATFQITVTPDNYDSAYQTIMYIKDELKIQNINCIMIRGDKANIISNDIKDKISNTYEQIQKELNKSFNDRTLQGYKNNSLTEVLLNAKNKMQWKYILKTFKENKYISPCCAGSLFGIIYENGNIFPCELLNSNMGNLKDFDYNFLDCWNSANAKEIKKNIKQSSCFCTFECAWLINLFSTPRYYPEIMYNILNNLTLRK